MSGPWCTLVCGFTFSSAVDPHFAGLSLHEKAKPHVIVGDCYLACPARHDSNTRHALFWTGQPDYLLTADKASCLPAPDGF
jgi:hypothetical protein